MATRPIFVPSGGMDLVTRVDVEFVWAPGMAPSQKKKNVLALHRAAADRGLSPLLEISSKSGSEVGRRLSAFSLQVQLPDGKSTSLESAFQGSKVFRDGGPYTDLYAASPRDAKRDARLKESGPLVEFRLQDVCSPLTPKTLFYDWLYIRALVQHEDYLKRLRDYAGFTDIEFNPQKSINCQARACAALVSLSMLGLLQEAAVSPQSLAVIADREAPLDTLF